MPRPATPLLGTGIKKAGQKKSPSQKAGAEESGTRGNHVELLF
jgi:hypothetical protein